jgi:hypothetical protein
LLESCGKPLTRSASPSIYNPRGPSRLHILASDWYTRVLPVYVLRYGTHTLRVVHTVHRDTCDATIYNAMRSIGAVRRKGASCPLKNLAPDLLSTFVMDCKATTCAPPPRQLSWAAGPRRIRASGPRCTTGSASSHPLTTEAPSGRVGFLRHPTRRRREKRQARRLFLLAVRLLPRATCASRGVSIPAAAAAAKSKAMATCWPTRAAAIVRMRPASRGRCARGTPRLG